ncbi:hypothetical protein J4G37_12350 [Microvirga sp. 3-52]|nr:hypothetical protein [Microvirga sp. 3-52]
MARHLLPGVATGLVSDLDDVERRALPYRMAGTDPRIESGGHDVGEDEQRRSVHAVSACLHCDR